VVQAAERGRELVDGTVQRGRVSDVGGRGGDRGAPLGRSGTLGAPPGRGGALVG
jgi:hypothetical protein